MHSINDIMAKTRKNQLLPDYFNFLNYKIKQILSIIVINWYQGSNNNFKVLQSISGMKLQIKKFCYFVLFKIKLFKFSLKYHFFLIIC